MYVSGVVAVLILIFSVLLILGVLPFTQFVVGGLFIAVCLGLAGPYIVRTPRGSEHGRALQAAG